ncbi:MAG: T9SS type A sorting domain-containing protein [Bacteroidales bacterium]
MKRNLLILAILIGLAFTGLSQENLNEMFNGSTLPTNWTFYPDDGLHTISTIQRTTENGNETIPCVDFQQYMVMDDKGAWMITPQLYVNNMTDSIIFWFQIENINLVEEDKVTVLVSTSNSEFESFDTTSPLLTIAYDSQEKLTRYAVNLSNYIGQAIYIAFHIDYAYYVHGEDDSYYSMGSYRLADVQGPEIYSPSCLTPTGLNVSNIKSDEVTVRWNTNENTSSYTIQLLDETKTNWNEADTYNNITDTTYVISALSPHTNYKIRINSNCGMESSDYSLYVTFSTLSNNIVTVPYNQTFEQDSTITDWAFYSTNETNKWVFGSADGYGTENEKHSLYVSSNNGITAASSAASTATFAVLRVQFGEDSEYKIGYKYKVKGIGQSWNGGMDYFNSYLIADSVDVVATTDSNKVQEGAIVLQGNTYNNQQQNIYWESFSKILNNVSNKTMKLVLMWHNTSGMPSTPASLIDNIVIESYVPCQNVDSTIDATICQGKYYHFHDKYYNENKTYTIVVSNDQGCDTTFTLNLTVLKKSDSTFNIQINQGETYTINGKEYALEGTYYDTVTTQNGCDSILKINISYNPCSSTIKKTIYDTICDNEIAIFNGDTLTQSGTRTATFITDKGCDSVVTFILTVLPTYKIELNATIDKGSSYNENGFNVSTEGTHTLNLTTTNGCDSTITLKLSFNNSINDLNDNNNFVIYPNPATEYLTLSIEQSNNVKKIQIIDSNGKIVKTITSDTAIKQTNINVKDLTKGAYYLLIFTDQTIIHKKVLIG